MKQTKTHEKKLMKRWNLVEKEPFFQHQLHSQSPWPPSQQPKLQRKPTKSHQANLTQTPISESFSEKSGGENVEKAKGYCGMGIFLVKKRERPHIFRRIR